MKYLGRTHRRCSCRYCAGDNNNVSILKAIKHGERQKVKKELKHETLRTETRKRSMPLLSSTKKQKSSKG